MNQKTYIEPRDDRHELVIPISKESLGSFIGNLLVKPQTIESSFTGHFDLEQTHIESVFHLVDQRIRQQNRGQLAQFTVTIIYDDDTTVLLNSLEDFLNYREIRPQISMVAELSWTYLIYFQDRPVPEKQIIELTISTLGKASNDPFILLFRPQWRSLRKSFVIRIQHTARTWGVDVENLLSGQIKSWIQSEHWIKKFIYTYPGWVGILFGFFIFCLCIWGGYLLYADLQAEIASVANRIKTLPLEKKIDYLVGITGRSPAEELHHKVGMGFLICFFVSLFVGGIISIFADNPPKSYLVLSEAAKKAKESSLQQRKYGWTYFLFSGLTATTAGVLSRYIFQWIFAK